MKNKKILILGATGFLGQVLTDYFKNKEINIVKHGFRSKADINSDLSDIKSTSEILDHKYDVVINLTCFSNVSDCQKDFNKAYTLNASIIKNIVSHIHPDTYLIHISTDHIYNSKRNNIFCDEEDISLVNNYAVTKFLGERFIQKHKKHLVIRTNFFGFSKTRKLGFVDQFLKLNKQKKLKYLVSDVYFNPVHISSINELIFKVIFKKKIYGVFNFGSENSISKSKFIKKIFKIMKVKLNKHKIVNYNKLSLKTPRPRNMLMSSKKIHNALKIKPIELNDEIKKLTE